MLYKPGSSYIKNIIILLGIAVLLIAVLPGSASASTGVITGSVVNVRSGPGTSYTIDGNFYQDTEVQILESRDGWYKITGGTLTGWVSRSLIEVTQEDKVMVTGDPVNLRSGPSTSTEIVGQVSKGDILTLLGSTGEWYQVRDADGSSCYIAAYLTEKVEESTPAAQTGQTSVPEAAAAVNSSGAPVVYLDNNKLSFDVEPMIENGRTLVPLRAIFEAMGASVQWDNTTRTVTAVKGDTTVVLPIGSTQPTVNGKEWPLDVPAKIYQDRTLAPLRFVGEAFGGTVEWDDTTRTITIASSQSGSSSSQSSSQQQVSAVIVSEEKINLRSGPSTQNDAISSALLGEKLDVLAQQDGWYQVSRGGSTAWVAGWVVDVAWEAGESSDPVDIIEPDTSMIKPNVLAGDEIWISSERNEDGVSIIMESGSRIYANIDESSGQITYEFLKRQIINDSGLEESLGSGKLTLTAINESDRAIIQIDLPEGIEYRTASENGGKKEILFIPNYIVEVSREVAGTTGDNIIIYTLTPCNFTTELDGDTLEVMLESTVMGIERAEYQYSISPVLKKMTISQSGTQDPVTKLKIETKNLGDYEVFQTVDDNALNIVLTADEKKEVHRENVIVIDPGHGGKDPGASGSTLKEKDVNLKIALEVGEILEDNGFNVEFTRTTDTYLTLTERAQFANDLNARLFVSIHNNASTYHEAHGTETFYYAPIEDPDLFWQKAERSQLATCLQRELVSMLRRTDRGVKQEEYTVLVKTEMPSALVEITFIDNEEEEALLMTNTFQKVAAQAIAEGIMEYLDE